jgi:uncharacterized integral membrane protein
LVRKRNGKPPGQKDTLQAVFIAVLASGLLTGILIIQNTRPARLQFLFWSASMPLSAALLLAAVAGGVLGFSVSFVRQRQLRRSGRARPQSGTDPKK